MRTKTMLGFSIAALLLVGAAPAAETYKVDPAHTVSRFRSGTWGSTTSRGTSMSSPVR
jgi:hypothetical protein